MESLFSIRHENGAVEFFREPLSPSVFAKVVYLKEGELIPVDNQTSLEKIRLVRRQAKEKVFVTNCLLSARVTSGLARRLDSRYHFCGAGRWLIAGF